MACTCREWNQAYAQLEMERGFCSLGGAEKYSPELVQRRAMESPAAASRVALRGAEMLWRLGLFACSLLADNLAGLSEERERVRLRARQLRCAAHLKWSEQAYDWVMQWLLARKLLATPSGSEMLQYGICVCAYQPETCV